MTANGLGPGEVRVLEFRQAGPPMLMNDFLLICVRPYFTKPLLYVRLSLRCLTMTYVST